MSAKAFRSAVEARDFEAMMAALSDDVVLHSPVTFKPFEGKPAVRLLLSIIVETLADFRYTDELSAEGVHGLIFRARVGDREVEGMDLVREGADGLIEDFTVMVRPMSGLIALAQTVGPRLEALASTGAPDTGAVTFG